MAIKINYLKTNKTKSKLTNVVLFSKEKFKINDLKNHLTKIEFAYISDLIKTIDVKKNIFVFDLSSKRKIVLISVKNNLKTSEVENLGAEFYGCINKEKNNEYFLISESLNNKQNNFLGHFLHGLKLKSYSFNKYKTKKDDKIISINIIGDKNRPSAQNQLKFKAVEQGTFYARDLVSEPGNILHPDEYAKRISSLKKEGLKINIYDDKKLKKLGMYALLGVGQGSIRGSYLVTIEWNGAKNNSKPLAFVGKGVCFDTGGYSLKPARFMEDMTYDMAGSATVVGLMKNLALRKAKVNAVGVVGLVENMVSGNAQRPGDIVKSYSGKTIEIMDTDAEGRLILADALTYAQEFNPSKIVDLATLTGSQERLSCGLFTSIFGNNTKFNEKLIEMGDKTNEKLVELPVYRRFIDDTKSDIADVKNSDFKCKTGAIYGAAFLWNFIDEDKFKWAHLDIAGPARKEGNITGVCVRLLSDYILEEK